MKIRFWNRYDRIFIIPTRFGILFFIGIGVMMLIAGTYSNNLVFLLSFFLFSIAVAALLQTHQNLKGMKAVKVQGGGGPVDHELHLWVEIESQKRGRAAAIDVDCVFRKLGERQESEVSARMDYILNMGRQRRDIVILNQTRGIYQFLRARVSTRFPLGLFYAWMWVPVDSEFFLYPAAKGNPQLPQGELDGESSEVGHLEGGQDFSGHRRFTNGESERHVDWKALARGRPRLIKEFRDGGPEKLLLDLDQTPGSTLEGRLEQVSLWLTEANRLGFQFGVRVQGRVAQPSSGVAQFYKCQRLLAEVRAAGESEAA